MDFKALYKTRIESEKKKAYISYFIKFYKYKKWPNLKSLGIIINLE